MRFLAAVLPLLLAAASPTPDPGLAAMQAQDARIARIAWRLQTASIGLCRSVARLPGFGIHSLGQYAPADRARVKAAFGIGARPAVLAVVPGSAADKAGLRAGDTIAAIAGRATSAALPDTASYAATADAEEQIEAGLAAGVLALTVERAGVATPASIAGDPGCASRVQVVAGRGVMAQADGRYVQMSDSAIDLAGSDDGVAALMAHELAHNFLAHRARLDAAKVSRGVFAGFGKGGAQLRQTEHEADRLSIWILARGGYSLDAAMVFWRGWAKRRDLGPFNAPSHPGWKDRLARMEAAIAEVKAQQAAGVQLVPAQ